MKIDDRLIDRIAELARLRLEETERDELKGELSRIVDYVEMLDEVDTTGVEPAPSVAAATAALRPDDPGECLTAEEALRNAPARAEQGFKVPPVIE